MSEVDMEPQLSLSAKAIIGSMLACVMTTDIMAAFCILKKNSSNIKPMTIFQANYFLGHGLICLGGLIVVVAQDKANAGEICPKETVRYFFVLSSIYDKMVLQLDRLVAVRFPYYYKE